MHRSVFTFVAEEEEKGEEREGERKGVEKKELKQQDVKMKSKPRAIINPTTLAAATPSQMATMMTRRIMRKGGSKKTRKN